MLAYADQDSVLIIWDTLQGGTPNLQSALQQAGFTVALSERATYDGTNPNPDDSTP